MYKYFLLPICLVILLFSRLEADCSPLYQQLLKEEPQALSTLYQLHEVDLAIGSLMLQACDGELLGAEPIALKRYWREQSAQSPQDIALCEGWWLQVDPTWKVESSSDASYVIQIPMLESKPPRHVLTLSCLQECAKKKTMQLRSLEGPICLYVFVRDAKNAPFRLKEVQPVGQEKKLYTYEPHPSKQSVLLTSVTSGNTLQSNYNYDSEGMLTQVWHLDKEGALLPFLQCSYKKGYAGAIDLDGVERRYHFSEKGMLTALETWVDEELLRVERCSWDHSNRLIEYSIHNKENACAGARRFSYNREGKCATTTLLGNLTGVAPDLFSLNQLEGVESLTTAYSYDEQGRLSEKCQGENKQVFAYLTDTLKLTSEYTWQKGAIKARQFYRYDAEGNCICLTQDDGSTLDSNSLEGVKQRVMMRLELQKGAKGLPHMIDLFHLDAESGKEEIDQTWVCSYDPLGRLLSKEEFNGAGQLVTSKAYTYDTQGRLLIERELMGPTYTYTYGPCSVQVLRCYENTSSTSTYSYDDAGRLLAQAEHSAHAFAARGFHYSPTGQRLEREDALGNRTFFQYDALGRRISQELPALLGIDDKPWTPRLEWGYDLLDRPQTHKDVDGYTTQICCTVYGQPYKKVYPDATLEKMRYTRLGKLSQACNREGKWSILQEGQGTTFCLDEVAEEEPMLRVDAREGCKKVLNSLGQWVLQQQTEYGTLFCTATYDALGNCVQLETRDALKQTVRLCHMRYDGAHRCIWQQHYPDRSDNQQPYLVQRIYGPMGRLEAVIEGSTQRTTYQYDLLGRLNAVTQSNGSQLFYTYDEQGRLAQIHSCDGKIDYAYSYDHEGRVILAEDRLAERSVKRCYNKAGQMVEEQLSFGHAFAYLYDDEGRLLTMTLPDGSHVCYTYDAQGLQAIVRKTREEQQLYTQRFVRDSQTGAIQEVELPYELGQITYKTDALGRRVALSSSFLTHRMQTSSEAPCSILSEERSDPLGDYKVIYAHDAWQQLIEESFEGNATFKDQAYQYDGLGNRICLNEKTSSFHENNQLVRANKTHYTYDANGNRISCEKGLKSTVYQYDLLNRLIAVEKPECTRATYTYDPLHRRTSRTMWSWNAHMQEWEMGLCQLFLYQVDREVGTVDSDGSTLLRVLMPETLSESGAMVGIERDGHLYVPLQDLHGSTCVLVDAESRKPLECYRRNAFGKEQLYQTDQEGAFQAARPEALINPWRMEGKRYDVESGLVYYGRRFYDPDRGIWLTKDPAGHCDGVQDYLFVGNNPLHRTDLHGLFSLSKLCSGIFDYAHATSELIHHGAEKVLQSILATRHIFDGVSRDVRVVTGFCRSYISKQLSAARSFYDTIPYTGVHGERELSDRIRFSYVNGILASPQVVLETLYRFSESHGGVRVHYTYRPSIGWSWDLLNAALVVCGCISPTAEAIADNWRDLIDEMGGIDSDGVIIHYAHSLGGAETACATKLLSEKEKSKIRIFTFGSPVLISDEGFAGVINYVGRRDLVSIVDLYRYAKARFCGEDSNIVFVGSSWGIPIADHYIEHPNFAQIITGLGRLFTLGVQ